MSALDPRSDAALLAAHVAGDGHAFGTLFTRHGPGLHRLARRRTDVVDDAEDAVQDALLAAHRTAGRFRHDAAVASWLHRIVVNACLDRRRRNVTAPISVPLPDRPLPTDPVAVLETVLVVRQALLQLPAEQRAAVAAVHMYGFTITDAARILGVAEGTVKSRCARGRARLAVLLRPDRVGAGP